LFEASEKTFDALTADEFTRQASVFKGNALSVDCRKPPQRGVAGLRGESSNRLLEILEGWNAHLSGFG